MRFSFRTGLAMFALISSTLMTAYPSAAATAALNMPVSETQSILGSVSDQLTTWLQENYATTFNSLGAAPGGNGLAVYLTSMSSEVESAIMSEIASMVGGLPNEPNVIFLPSAHSGIYESHILSEITPLSEFQTLTANGVDVREILPFPDGLVHIGVYNLTPANKNLLDTIFGAGNILIQNLTANEVPVATFSRTNDASPWNGGDAILGTDYVTGGEAGCTSGPGITYGGNVYVLTAGHCFKTGTSISNAMLGGSGATMGDFVSQDMTYGGDDTGRIAAQSSGYVWTGAIGSPKSVPVYSDASSPVNFTVYNEGAYSGEVSSVVQTTSINGNGCILVTLQSSPLLQRYECNIIESSNPSAIANQAGDSGAPVIRYVSGNLDVVGIVSAGGGSAPCQYNPTTCYNQLFYTAMNEILSTEYPGAGLIRG